MTNFVFQPTQTPQAAEPVLPTGSLKDFFAQPTTSGRAPAFSWKDAVIGTSISGAIDKTVEDSDILPDTDINKQVKTWKDGSPRWVMAISIDMGLPSEKYPDGIATVYAKGQMQYELVRAVREAGRNVPTAGDAIRITLTDRKPGRNPIPQNIFTVEYVANKAPEATIPVATRPVAPIVAPPVDSIPAPNPVQPVATSVSEADALLAQLRKA